MIKSNINEISKHIGIHDQTYWFFEHGNVTIKNVDNENRQASFLIVMPAIIAHTVTPSLLGSGLIDQYELMNPLYIWMPTIHKNRFNIDIESGIVESVNISIKSNISGIINLFNSISQIIIDPSDLISMLPMGIYIKFRLRCSIDKLALSIEELGKTSVIGVPEFRYALASALKDIIS